MIKPVLFMLLLSVALSVFASPQKAANTTDLVPNDTTAIKIAEAIWLSKYGDKIFKCKPFKARLVDTSIWEVYGTLPSGSKGGCPHIKIKKSNCEILSIEHGK